MLNFRFHIVSLVAVFLALAIGIIMGSTVIDRALVDTLEDQQQTLRGNLDELSEENSALREELRDLRDGAERLASEGGERLLSGTLADVPVLVVAVRGVESSVLDDLGQLLETAGAVDQGTLWLTDRLALEDEAAVADLVEALDVALPPSLDGLRTAALSRVAVAIRGAVAERAGDGVPGDDGEEERAVAAAEALEVLRELRSAGFVEYDAPEGSPDDVADLAVPGTSVVLVSGATAEVPDGELAVPLARALVADGPTQHPTVELLAAEAMPPEPEEGDASEPAPFVGLLREEDAGDRLSTVDNLDDFAGRLAAVIAIQDLRLGRRGHYGVGPGAQRLVPAPPG